MKNANWKKIVSGIAIIVTVALGAYTSKTLTGADLQKLLEGATLVTEGAGEQTPVAEPQK